MPEENSADELALALKRGDEKALQGLMERFGEPLLSFIWRRVGDIEDARELTQETFVRVYRSIDRWEPRAPFHAWLFRIALNLARDHAKSRSQRNRSLTQSFEDQSSVSGEWAPVDTGAAERLMNQDDLVILKKLIQELPPKLREPLILHTLEGYSAQETAAILSLPVRSVESRVYRARQRLRALWSQES